LELPIAIRLPPQRHADLNSIFHLLIKLLHAFHADVRIPHAAAARQIKVWLSKSLKPLEHDLDRVATDRGKDVGRILRKRKTRKAEFGFVPANRRPYIGNEKGRRNCEKLYHPFQS